MHASRFVAWLDDGEVRVKYWQLVQKEYKMLCKRTNCYLIYRTSRRSSKKKLFKKAIHPIVDLKRKDKKKRVLPGTAIDISRMLKEFFLVSFTNNCLCMESLRDTRICFLCFISFRLFPAYRLNIVADTYTYACMCIHITLTFSLIFGVCLLSRNYSRDINSVKEVQQHNVIKI